MALEINFCSKEEADENEDDEYEMHGQALPVPPFDINAVDEGSIPLTSQEYLQQSEFNVFSAERARLPAIVTASVPKLKSGNNQDIANLFREEELDHSEHCASQEWIQAQVSDFSDLRYRIECNRETWLNKYPKKFPSDQNDWFKFLFGGSVSSETDQHDPYLDIMMSMNNEMIENLIKYIVEWVVERKISVYTAGLWFYGLLACIDVPIRVKIMKRLRTFAHTCRELRKHISLSEKGSEKEIMAHNLFICLIGKYFGQHDLSDK